MAVFGAIKVEIDLIYLKLLEAIWLQKMWLSLQIELLNNTIHAL